MKKLKITSLYDNVHFIFIFIVLLILSLKYWYLLILLLIYLLFIYRKTSLFFITVLFGILIIASYLWHSPVKSDVIIAKGVVIEVADDNLIFYSKGYKYLVYHDDSFKLGDAVIFKIKKENYNNELFDYNDYLSNQGINGPYKLMDYEVFGNRFVTSKINEYFINKVSNHPSLYKGYISSLIFSDSSSIANVKTQTTKIGVSHILAVSGMHISLLILVVEFILKRLFYLEKPIDIGIIIFLLTYIIITNFSLTVLRASLMVILTKLFKMNKMIFTKLDILSVVGIILLLVNPKSLFLISFQLSFLVSFIILIFTTNIIIKNKLINMYFMSFISFLVGIPLIINVNYEFNLLSIILGPFYILFFELLLYPVTLLMFIIPKSHNLFIPIYEFFEYITSYLSNFNRFNVIVGKLNIILILVYYVLLFFMLSSFEIKRFRKYTVIIFILFLSFIYNKNSFNPFLVVKFYNVGQGDSAIIMLPKGEGYILFDCYNNINDYLKRDGIRKIDIIFLTHGHTDHINSYPALIEELKVEKTYSSYYDNSELLNDYKGKYEIQLLKSGDLIKYKSFKFDILGPIKSYSNENDNSLVVKFEYNNLSFLFTGDIEVEAEKDLVNKYGENLKSDVLKVPHHGSISSSSKIFLESVNPRYYLISVGLNNYYKLPNNQLVLANSNLYRTDLDGTICFYYNKKLKIKTVYR